MIYESKSARQAMKITTEGFNGSARERKSFIEVCMCVWRVVDRLIPGAPPFGNREIVLHRNSPRVLWEPCDLRSNCYRISLNAQAGNWQQVTYQLSHELAHVKMGPARSNLLLEVFAESVAVLSLISMENEWKTNPPFTWNGWKKYAESIQNYIQGNAAFHIRDLPQGITGPKSMSGDDRRVWLRELRSQVDKLKLQDGLSRAWQHIAATLLAEDALNVDKVRCHQLLSIAQQTTPPPEREPAYQEDLPIIPSAIPSWVPDWLR